MLRVMVLASLVALAGCHRQANAPGDAPTGLAAAPGEGLVTVSWDQLPGLTYWIFFQAGSSVAARDPGVPLLFDVHSPRVVSGLVNGVQYAFVMNATDRDSPGGPSTPHSALNVIFISFLAVPATENPSEVAPASVSILGTPVVMSVSLATRVAEAFNISAEAVDPTATTTARIAMDNVSFLIEKFFMVVFSSGGELS